MKKKRGIAKYFVVVALAFGIVFGVKIISTKETFSYSVPLAAVTLAQPVSGTMEESITINGHIETRSMIPVIPLVSGTIVDYPARAGEKVKAGQILAQIDPEPFRQQVLQAQAAYTGYESSFKRVEALYQGGAASRQEYDTVKAQRDAARAQYDLAVLQLGYASVSSPIEGTVLTAPLSTGSVAAAPQPVAVIADLQDLVVRLRVPEKYFSYFSQHKDRIQAQISLPQLQDKIAYGKLDTLAPYIDGASKTFEAVFNLEEGSETLSPGMFVRVKIIFSIKENVALLPITAVKSDGTAFYFEGENAGNDDEKIIVTGNESMTGVDGIRGTVDSLTLVNSLSDNQWIVVPDEYRYATFVVEGHEKILPGQSVVGHFLELDWENQ